MPFLCRCARHKTKTLDQRIVGFSDEWLSRGSKSIPMTNLRTAASLATRVPKDRLAAAYARPTQNSRGRLPNGIRHTRADPQALQAGLLTQDLFGSSLPIPL